MASYNDDSPMPSATVPETERMPYAEEYTILNAHFKGTEISEKKLLKMARAMRKYDLSPDDPSLLESGGGESDSDNSVGGGSDGDDDDNSDNDDDDDNDDDASAWDAPDVDIQVLKTISAIRSKNNRVYDSQVNFFDESQMASIRQEWQKRQAGRQDKSVKPASQTAEASSNAPSGGDGGSSSSGQESDSDSGNSSESESESEPETEAEAQPKKRISDSKLSHADQQDFFKRQLRAAADGVGLSEPEDESGMFAVKDKTEEEIAQEQEEYRQFLLENVNNDVEASSAFQEWSGLGLTEPANADDQFLMGYLTNRGWQDKTAQPTKMDKKEVLKLIEDQDEEEIMDAFEEAYDFRFEDGSSAYYQKPLDSSLCGRRKESRRKIARQRLAEQKRQEKLARKQELAHLTKTVGSDRSAAAAVSASVSTKQLAKLRRITGNPNLTLDDAMLEGDFLDSNHEQLMEKLLSAGADENMNEKPVFSDDEDDLGRNVEQESDDADDNDDDDSSIAFKYQKVKNEDYGLSAVEILLADDADLESYINIDELAPYRTPFISANTGNGKQRTSRYSASRRQRKPRHRNKNQRTEMAQGGEDGNAPSTWTTNDV
ncbi:hypothetical protein BJ085DRAFT_27140 [Dimargaris cristalligena]|uniref:Kri1-like C-terminal domain-containing protein n=1 Tax=Dimargaris cristalligena TaxID=215637 RepID=A0A4P9ZR42_9FUNG|nr:hypothetical protein BJ085DRAFT_27140 [Dimargaris cristalligena]|eukprot:RKP35805.1 hypothetical protein BJ085DRAFT_27140 [Dimargaris cristalligena]